VAVTRERPSAVRTRPMKTLTWRPALPGRAPLLGPCRTSGNSAAMWPMRLRGRRGRYGSVLTPSCSVAARRRRRFRAATQPRAGLAVRSAWQPSRGAWVVPPLRTPFNCSAALRLDARARRPDAPQLTQSVRTPHAGRLLRCSHLLLRRVRSESSGTVLTITTVAITAAVASAPAHVARRLQAPS
jgi:hypothetical protein